jgi:hypothetical protein
MSSALDDIEGGPETAPRPDVAEKEAWERKRKIREEDMALAKEVLREAGRRREAVDHPAHYGGKDDPYECIKVIEAWQLGFALGNTVKYIARAGKKDDALDGALVDLKKARWYLDRHIERLERDLAKLRDPKER